MCMTSWWNPHWDWPHEQYQSHIERPALCVDAWPEFGKQGPIWFYANRSQAKVLKICAAINKGHVSKNFIKLFKISYDIKSCYT